MRTWAELLLGNRLLAWCAVAAVTLLAGWGVSRLQIDDVPASIFRSDDEEYARLEEVHRDFGSDDNDCLVVLEAEDFFTPEGVALLRAVDARLEAVDGVLRVTSLADVLVLDGGLLPRPLLPDAGAAPEAFDEARRRAADHPLVAGRMLSADGRTTLAVATLAGRDLPISVLERRLDALESALRAATGGTAVRARTTGIPLLRRVIFAAIERDQKRFSIAGALVGFLVGLAIFRRPGPILITSLASILAGFCALGAMGLLNTPVNLLNAALPLLVMIIAFTDAVHLMMHVLRRRQEGSPPLDAAKDSIRRLGRACALTSLTTAIGFGSLALSRVELIQRFGVLFAGAVGMTFLVVLTVVPLASSHLLRQSHAPALAERYGGLRRPAERLIRWVVGHARGVSVVGFLITAALFLVALRLVPDNRLTESAPRGEESVEVLDDLERTFGGSMTLGVLCEWSLEEPPREADLLEALGGVSAVLAAGPFTHTPTSALDLLALVPGAREGERLAALSVLPPELVGRYLRPDLGRALVSALVPDAGSAVAEPAYADLEARLDEVRARHPRFDLHLTGTAFVARRNVNLMITDFATGLAVAAFAIFVVLSLTFGSLRLGAISVVPNAFPLVVAASALVLLGLELQVTSVIAFTVCLGIAVDDTIHYVTRFRRELDDGYEVPEAAVRAFLGVGRALIVTTAVMLGGFGVMFFSAIPTTQLFALIGSLALLAALIGDLLLLPAMVVAFHQRR